jgi:predicted helicase
LSKKIKTLFNNPSDDFKKKYNVKDSSSYQLTKKIKGAIFSEDCITECNYRPFDLRFLYYDAKILSRPNFGIFQHIRNKPNTILTVKRQNKFEPFSYAFVLDKITESCFFESSFANNSIFPLYLYSNDEKTVNFTQKFSDFIQKQYQSAFTPEDILNYMYAVLHSPVYRKKYAEFLKIDFPRIPFTPDKKMFKKLSKLGKELIDEHLRDEGVEIISHFIGKGTDIVENVTYIQEKNVGKIYINKMQYFDNVPLNIWEFQIGGYQVIDKYLKERKNRELSLNEMYHVEFVTYLIGFTIKQMNRIDHLTNKWI